MLNQGIGSWSARRARKTPDRIALVHEDRTWTYRDLHERVLRLAHALRAQGVGRGDRVAYLGPNHPTFLETLFATGALGAVFVPLNTRLTAPELAYNLTDSGTRILIHAEPQGGTAREAARQADAPRLIPLGPAYEDLLTTATPTPLDEPVTPDDPCMIMYTSGTTGRPKGAVLTHANITWNSVNVLVDTDLAGDEVTLVVAPLFHTAGLNMTCLPTLLKGGRAILHSAFDPDQVLHTIETHRVTCMFGVPTMYDAMAARPRWATTDLTSLRTLNCGGAPVPARTIAAYLARGLAFSQGYGLTEASPGVLYLDASQTSAKAGSAGVPHFFTDTRLVAPDGTDAAPGERGEILVQGPHVMTGYWNRPADTEAAFADGRWLRTGDVARTDADGYAYIVDRVKDMYVSGGENVYPAEVEDALLTHPAVAECAVIGVADPVWGESGRAIVVLRPGTDATETDLLDHLRARLAKYKIPKSVVRADTLPRTASGKLVKPALRRTYGDPTP
ncbi:acyl-CoA synthetase [Streptomyces fumanus]|uniref:acyl-CoA synthetase n=1 Tax=Streptomyces fumanus TaxID=67302 RepID=UPI00167F0780|nr:long-chain fatty acid--CoA ligase [Streptomyces fumanus]